MTGLRRAVLVAVLSGQAAAATAGVLPWPALPAVLLLTVVGARLAAGADEARARLLRGTATGVAVVLAVALLPTALSSGEPREVLGPLLVGVAVAQTLTWQARRDLQSGLLAAVGLLVLGASFAPDVLVGLPLLVGWGAALAAGVLLGRARTTEGADLVLRGASEGRGLLVAPCLAVVLGLVAFLLVPAPQDAGLRSRLAAAAGSTGLDVTRGALGAGVFSSGRVDLRVRGELGETPLLEVDAASPELWRGAVYDTWDGRSWQSSASGLTELSGPPYVVEDVAPTRLDTARVVGPSDGTILAPGRPVRIDSPAGRVLTTADGAVRTDGVDGYRVASVVLPSPAPALAGADVRDPRWLQLPPTLPARVRTLAAELTAGRDRPAAVAAVEDWLRTNATYRTDSPVPGRGEDAVDRFLFVDRTGFCEQFAAAGVVLLRAGGIPARFVSGVAYGTAAADGRRLYREKDLHTWVEVFHPGTGWVTSDPTAGAPRDASAAASWRSRLATPLATALRRADAVPGGRPAIAGALLLATSLVVVVRRPRRPEGGPAAAVPAGPALAAFLQWDRGQGPARRAPSESLGELGRRLPPAQAQAVAVVERECYAAVPPGEDEVAATVSALHDGWAGEAPLR